MIEMLSHLTSGPPSVVIAVIAEMLSVAVRKSEAPKPELKKSAH
jgi:hypothetical protein